MADLARETVRPGLHPAVHADRARDAGAQRHEQEAVRALARADPALGEAAGAHVVAERGRDAQLGAYQLTQGYVAPAQVGGVGGDTGRLVDDAGDGDTGRGGGLAQGLRAVGAQLGGEAEDVGDDRVGAALASGRPTGLVQQRAVRPDQGGFHTGAAHVEGDDMSHGGQCGPYTCERSSPLRGVDLMVCFENFRDGSVGAGIYAAA